MLIVYHPDIILFYDESSISNLHELNLSTFLEYFWNFKRGFIFFIFIYFFFFIMRNFKGGFILWWGYYGKWGF